MHRRDKAKELFAAELRKYGENGLAQMVEEGSDNSHGGQAALAAIEKALSLPNFDYSEFSV